jgi:hypothetical protein
MDLVIVILFLALYYLRPQEWSGAFASIHWVQICMLGGLASLVFRQKSIRPRDLFQTPHDWVVFAFWAWIIISSPDRWQAFKENANLYIFYIVIVQVLYSVPRLKLFLGWWTFLIVSVATLALATKWGFDPLDSLSITNGSMKGRLVLNLSIFDNPNGLGHSVVPAIPMLYYYLIWKRPMTSRAVGLGLMFLPLYCILETVSKGAFLSAGVTTFATMAIGRPKRVQIAMAILAAMFGTGLVFALPRMNELSKSKTDPAIQGRVQAFKHGYEILQTRIAGVGKGHWGDDPFITDYVTEMLSAKPSAGAYAKGRVIYKPIRHSKAPHSSYVCTGGETGKPGLFLFVAVLYCCLRTTTSARTQTTDEERIRRILFVLVVSYVVSSWMVDFEYRATFFMFTAAIAALHRHLLAPHEEQDQEHPAMDVPLEPPVPVWIHPPLAPQPAFAGAAGGPIRESLLLEEEEEEEPENALPGPKTSGIAWDWHRLGWLDLLLITVGWWTVIRCWAYMMNHM